MDPSWVWCPEGALWLKNDVPKSRSGHTGRCSLTQEAGLPLGCSVSIPQLGLSGLWSRSNSTETLPGSQGQTRGGCQVLWRANGRETQSPSHTHSRSRCSRSPPTRSSAQPLPRLLR